MRSPVVIALLGALSCDGAHDPKNSTAEPPARVEAADSSVLATHHEADDAEAARDAERDATRVVAKPTKPTWTPRPEDEVTVHQALEFPEKLDAFFDALARVDDGEQEVVRVLHFGASMIGMDDLPGILRHRFQTRFGDGGAGMVLLQRFMTNYIHRGAELDGKGWKHCYIGYLCKKDGHYGLGGVTFFSEGGGKTTIATRKKAPGDTVSKFEVWYAAEPRAGNLAIRVDGGEPVKIDTAGETLEDRWHAIDVEPGPHEIEVKAAGGGRARAYGVVLETDGPGITWEQFSWLGAFTKRMDGWDAEHIAGQIAHRDPHLVAFTFGGNDTRRVANGKLDHDGYVDEYARNVKKVMAGKPGASCLIIGMTDRGRSLTFTIEKEDVELIENAQRETARQAGCAFFDTLTAMGGHGTIHQWRKKNPPLATPDLKHLTHEGRKIFGGWIYDAIIDEYVKHRTGK